MYTSQKCSIHTPLQNHASIPFIHIEPKQSNEPEVNYKGERVLHKRGRPAKVYIQKQK